ncbi:urease accessory protein UreF [Paenibacillus sp. y28]|uniref:urease accessory protein UreF n=1 Tax=Paenibacillus sp. y28 TaxID=3129110 RepID=UPI003019D3CB
MSSERTTAWLAYTQLLDSALPIGAFSHSFGLETMVQLGEIQTVDELKRYLAAMLVWNWAPADGMGIKAVYTYAPEARWEELWRTDQRLHAQRLASETRDGVQKMGRRLLLLCQNMHPQLMWQPLEQAVRQRHTAGTHAVVHGWTCWQFGLPLEMAAEGYLYTCLTTSVGSALRLMSMGQTEGQALIVAMLPFVQEAWRRAADGDPGAPRSTALGSEIFMMKHEELYSRLFMS